MFQTGQQFSAVVQGKDKFKLTVSSAELANAVKDYVRSNNLSWQEDYNVLVEHGTDSAIFNIYYNELSKQTVIILGSLQGMQIQFPVKVSLSSTGNELTENFWKEIPTAPTGGAKNETKTYQGRRYVVRKGERGGKYILVKGKRVYC